MKKDLSVVAVKYGETLLPERMIFADRPESEARFPISLTLYLIETGDRKILVDAGCDTMPGYDVKDHISPAEALRRYGVAPEEITDVILTHAHHDHIEAVHYFKNATVYISAGQYEAAQRRGFIPADMKVVVFEKELSLGGVRALVWGGHANGSAIVTLSHGGREYVISGDECYTRTCLTECRPTGNAKNAERALAFVKTFADPRYTVLIAHDPEILPGQNGHFKIF